MTTIRTTWLQLVATWLGNAVGFVMLSLIGKFECLSMRGD